MTTIIKYDKKELKKASHHDIKVEFFIFMGILIPVVIGSALALSYNSESDEDVNAAHFYLYVALGFAIVFFIRWLSKLSDLEERLKGNNNFILEISNKGIKLFKDKFYKWSELHYKIEEITYNSASENGESYYYTVHFLVFTFKKHDTTELDFTFTKNDVKVLRLESTSILNKSIYEIVSICDNYRNSQKMNEQQDFPLSDDSKKKEDDLPLC